VITHSARALIHLGLLVGLTHLRLLPFTTRFSVGTDFRLPLWVLGYSPGWWGMPEFYGVGAVVGAFGTLLYLDIDFHCEHPSGITHSLPGYGSNHHTIFHVRLEPDYNSIHFVTLVPLTACIPPPPTETTFHSGADVSSVIPLPPWAR